jgi:hypothetical protein
MQDDRPPIEIRNKRTSSWWAARWLALAVRWARLTAFCTFALVVALLVNTRRARGDVGEKMMVLGRELLPMADLLSGAQQVRINGESMFLASTVTDQSIGEVLDRYERHCQEHTGGLREELDSVPSQAKALLASKFPAAWSQRLGIVREQQDDEGMVVCIARDGGEGIRGLVEHANLFIADGELSHLGNLRYAYARKTSTGQTHLLTTFTEGPFNIYRILGGGASQHREELDRVPLPTNALTPMTFRVEGMPYAAQVFQSPQPPNEIAAYYIDALPRLGWEKVAGPGELFSNIVMRREGVTLIMTAVQLEDGGKTNVVLVDGAATVVENAVR